MALLFDAVSVGVHGVDVHDAVAIAEEVDAAVPEHRLGRSAGVVGCEGNGFGFSVELPDALGSAALVALGFAWLLEPAGKEEDILRRIRRFGCFSEGNDFARAHIVDEHQLRFRQSGITRSADDQAAIGSKSFRPRIAVPGAALRQAALDGHGVDLGGAFEFSAEGYGLAVGGEYGVRFGSGIGGEAARDTSICTDLPEVTFRGEDDVVATDSGGGVVTAMNGRGVGRMG